MTSAGLLLLYCSRQSTEISALIRWSQILAAARRAPRRVRRAGGDKRASEIDPLRIKESSPVVSMLLAVNAITALHIVARPVPTGGCSSIYNLIPMGGQS